jgi:cell wall-associated NlpC family hydrolase
MAAIPVAYVAWAAVAAAAVSAVAAVQQGQATSKMAKYNAQVMENQAVAERQKAALEEQRHRARTTKLLSTQRALIAKSGLDLEGSPLLVMEDTAAQSELDSLLIRYNGEMGANRAQSQAGLDRMRASSASTGGYLSAGASLLNGVSRMGSIYGPTAASSGASSGLGANNGGFTQNPGGIDAQ